MFRCDVAWVCLKMGTLKSNNSSSFSFLQGKVCSDKAISRPFTIYISFIFVVKFIWSYRMFRQNQLLVTVPYQVGQDHVHLPITSQLYVNHMYIYIYMNVLLYVVIDT